MATSTATSGDGLDALAAAVVDELVARIAGRHVTTPELQASAEDPAPRKRRKVKLPRTIEPKEAEAILGACNLRTATGLRDRCLIELMYRAGLRLGEVRRLRPRDVDLERCQIRIYDSKGGDGTSYFDDAPAFDGHTIPELLQRWLDRRERELRKRCGKVPRDAPLFCSIRAATGKLSLGPTDKPRREPAGRVINERSVAQMLKRRAAKAGVDPRRVTAHRFRHSYATQLLEEGFTIYDVKELLRHQNIATTERYLHVTAPHLQAKVKARSRSRAGQPPALRVVEGGER